MVCRMTYNIIIITIITIVCTNWIIEELPLLKMWRMYNCALKVVFYETHQNFFCIILITQNMPIFLLLYHISRYIQ